MTSTAFSIPAQAWNTARARAVQTDRWRAMFRNTRPWNTWTAKRICNGCGRLLGDASPIELHAARHWQSLPDVTGECGCTEHTVCSHCLLPPGPAPCCPAFDGTTTTMTERALRVFRKDFHSCPSIT